jgi:hypothetical protein
MRFLGRFSIGDIVGILKRFTSLLVKLKIYYNQLKPLYLTNFLSQQHIWLYGNKYIGLVQ